MYSKPRALLALFAETAIVASLSCQQARPPSVVKAVRAHYTAAEVERFEAMIPGNRLSLSVDNTGFALKDGIAPPDTTERFQAALETAARQRHWSEAAISAFITPLRNDREMGLSYMLSNFSDGLPSVLLVPEDKDARAFVCVASFPGPIDQEWEIDRKFFEWTTGIAKSERPLPPKDRIHAYVIGHEFQHCEDREFQKTTRLVYELAQQYRRIARPLKPFEELLASFRWAKPFFDAPSEENRKETFADTAVIAVYARVFGDKETTFEAIASARAMDYADPTHASQTGIRKTLGRKTEAKAATAPSFRNIRRTLKNLDAFVQAAARKKALDWRDPKARFGILAGALATRRIKPGPMQDAAQDYTAAFHYFMPLSSTNLATALATPDGKARTLAPGTPQRPKTRKPEAAGSLVLRH